MSSRTTDFQVRRRTMGFQIRRRTMDFQIRRRTMDFQVRRRTMDFQVRRVRVDENRRTWKSIVREAMRPRATRRRSLSNPVPCRLFLARWRRAVCLVPSRS